MKIKNKEAMQNLLQTENPHWNEFAHRLHCKATEKGLFTNTEDPIQLVNMGTDILSEYYKNPVQGIELLFTEIAKAKLTAPQQLFIYNWIDEYLKITEFDGEQLTQAQNLLQSHTRRLRKEIEPEKPLVKNIREMLKAQIQKELVQLPETLKGLEPEKRLNIICKLIPFVLPKVEAVHPTEGEPISW